MKRILLASLLLFSPWFAHGGGLVTVNSKKDIMDNVRWELDLDILDASIPSVRDDAKYGSYMYNQFREWIFYEILLNDDLPVPFTIEELRRACNSWPWLPHNCNKFVITYLKKISAKHIDNTSVVKKSAKKENDKQECKAVHLMEKIPKEKRSEKRFLWSYLAGKNFLYPSVEDYGLGYGYECKPGGSKEQCGEGDEKRFDGKRPIVFAGKQIVPAVNAECRHDGQWLIKEPGY